MSDDNLTLWTDLVWEMQPKFFKKMPKEEMKHQVYSFLCEHMSLEKAQVCYLNSIKDGMQYAIPNELYDEFDGFLERLIAFEKKHGYLKPAVNFVSF